MGKFVMLLPTVPGQSPVPGRPRRKDRKPGINLLWGCRQFVFHEALDLWGSDLSSCVTCDQGAIGGEDGRHSGRVTAIVCLDHLLI
jgi:hypothetical protein